MKKPWQKERSTGGEAAVQLRSGGRNGGGDNGGNAARPCDAGGRSALKG